MKTTLAIVLAGVVSLFSPSVNSAEPIEKTIVSIVCTNGAITSRGSGVVVSSEGHVLTAKHVVQPTGVAAQPNFTCKGSVGIANAGGLMDLTRRQVAVPETLDVALLQFALQDPVPFAKFCQRADLKVRSKIFVAGFPSGTMTGVPSFREGILSTIFPDAREIVETDGQTINGMSGGPVFAESLEGLIGIVIGANFAQGGVSYFGILPVFRFSEQLGLTESDAPCYRASRGVELSEGQSTWRTGDPMKMLGVRTDDGICFIKSVFGQFNDPDDQVGVSLQNSQYALHGSSDGGGQHGATAQCIWFDRFIGTR